MGENLTPDGPAEADEPDIFCFNCTWYSEEGGQCHRHAPKPTLGYQDFKNYTKMAEMNDGDGDGYDRTVWPVVSPRDFCGEWKEPAEPPRGGWMRAKANHPSDDQT